MNYKSRVLVSTLLLGSSLTAVAWWYMREHTAAATAMQVEAPQKRTVTNKRVIAGNLVPQKEATLKAQLPGILDKVYVDIGERVKKGAPIARIKAMPKIGDVENAKKALHIAQIIEKQAHTVHKRNRVLLKKKMLSREKYEYARKTWEVAREEAAYAKRQLELTRKGYIKKGAKDNANIIRSTISGVVSALPHKEGTSITEQSAFSEGSTIAVISDMDTMLFQGEVGEMDVIYLTKGMQFEVSLNAVKDQTFCTTLTRIAPKSMVPTQSKEQGSVKFAIEGTIQLTPKDKDIIRAGYTAMADIVLGRAIDVITIKEQWVQSEECEDATNHKQTMLYYVWVYENDKKVKRYVKLGISDGIYVEVKEGLAVTDKVITADD